MIRFYNVCMDDPKVMPGPVKTDFPPQGARLPGAFFRFP